MFAVFLLYRAKLQMFGDDDIYSSRQYKTETESLRLFHTQIMSLTLQKSIRAPKCS